MPSLSSKELRICKLIAEGLHNKDIGRELGNTSMTIRNYTREIYDKLGMHSRLEIALWYVRHIEFKERP